ncbi:Trans-1,2-dihydrobenzene-1,2-diol dehydrogenase [Cyphellophora attinorum]|uniref:Trans-1,2-dihydrobenzene-1,2-diol dehydrogenase n=1 Tax=Cyphellophora attinorum TaxID=1664694 RepID=A0A0N0NJ64_9EURO|nr:Trans-1,2-dihydrobenzene-1,2-diol dehydrogenase [Phialophora attinorum]KPI36249.1 Trans-1,2-dihydrobenzene-1,2-diol dehydrogenase [Phialophora attinorum]
MTPEIANWLGQAWIRYFPLSIYVRELVSSGRLGKVSRVFADLSNANKLEESIEDSHRMVSPDLAGGALLDLGFYSLTWIFQTLYSTQGDDAVKPQVLSSMQKYRLGTDEMTTVLLTFPRSEGGDAHGIATTSIRVASDPDGKRTAGPCVRIQGDRGEVQVFPPAYRPTRTKLVLQDGTVDEKVWEVPGVGPGSGWYNGFAPANDWNAEGEGHGMFWEADECALALRDGRKEGRFESLDESIAIMQVMDEVRQQHGMTYPERIETTEYPVHV